MSGSETGTAEAGDRGALTSDGRGALVALLDRTMAQAARVRAGGAREAEAVDLHVSFVRPVAGRLVAEGRAVGGGRSTCFCEARLVGAGGDVAAQAMGTYRYREATAAP